MSWKLKRTRQCKKCPWLVDVNPHDIPNGYDEEKHQALISTIAQEGDSYNSQITAMACHLTDNAHCIGWLINQTGPGNNIPLRIKMMSCINANQIKLIGNQHSRFEDTLPQALEQSL